MDDESLRQRVLHLRQVEKLSQRQISDLLVISRKRVGQILKGQGLAILIPKTSILDEYRHLIAHWYKQYPRLQSTQVYDRLKTYGYKGSYISVARVTRKYRTAKPEVYHPLTFLPGEEAQVDWFFFNHERLGQVAGFVYLLSYSRYAWGVFYQKTSFEFFIAGHLECFKHLNGLARCHRYDNLKSVVIRRSPETEYNPQFLDFARFYGFSIHACNPYSGNEKGRVERLIRDIRGFLYGETFVDLRDLNDKFHIWLGKRNTTVHRVTDKTPKELLAREHIMPLPEHSYPASRIITASVSKTAQVEFETNRYSVPSSCAGKTVTVAAYTGHIEIYMSEQKVATHGRCFGRKQTIQNPLHAEKLLNTTPQFKSKRILQLITQMEPVFQGFIENQENDTARMDTAYLLFSLLRTHSRGMITSAVRELIGLACFKAKALKSLLNLPEPQEPQPLWPQDKNLLNLNYKERSLNDYDPNSRDMETA
jgi:transposase